MSSTVPSKRLRLSIWVGNVPLDDATVAGGRMLVDDLTMLMTIVNRAGSNVIAYEPNMHAERTASEVAVCHKYGIQCLAGLSLTFTSLAKHPRVATFEQFLRRSKKDPALIPAKAEEIVALIDQKTKKGPRALTEMFDGVGFDNENLDGPDDKPQLVEFYRAVADAVAKPAGCGGRFVSVANAPLSSPIRLVLSSRLPPGSPPKLGEANTFMRNHDHTMNAGLENLVMRPMCYDAFSAVPPTPASKRAQWHADALDYAVGRGGTNTPPGPATRPSLFQMGFKNSPGDNNNPANFGKGDFANLDGIVEPGKEMEDVCWRMRRAGVGVALFAFPTSGGSELAAYYARIARYNYVLNGAANADGPDWSRFKPATPWADTCTPGPATQPVQVPIGKDGQARLGKP